MHSYLLLYIIHKLHLMYPFYLCSPLHLMSHAALALSIIIMLSKNSAMIDSLSGNNKCGSQRRNLNASCHPILTIQDSLVKSKLDFIKHSESMHLRNLIYGMPVGKSVASFLGWWSQSASRWHSALRSWLWMACQILSYLSTAFTELIANLLSISLWHQLSFSSLSLSYWKLLWVTIT